jgi:5-methylcytosine-specific restriction endonuclease McrA
MPIRPENKKLYPKSWPKIRSKILARAASCEWCAAKNYNPHPLTGSKVVLTIAHLDHNPKHNDPENLRALCQKCHNNHDAPFRLENRKRNKILDAEKAAKKKRKTRSDKGKKRNLCTPYGWCEVHGEHGP